MRKDFEINPGTCGYKDHRRELCRQQNNFLLKCSEEDCPILKERRERKIFDLAIEVLKGKIADLIELSSDDNHWRDMMKNLEEVDNMEEAVKLLEKYNE